MIKTSYPPFYNIIIIYNSKLEHDEHGPFQSVIFPFEVTEGYVPLLDLLGTFHSSDRSILFKGQMSIWIYLAYTNVDSHTD